MPALFVFLLKVNIALLLFCAGYYLVLRHLTFYTLNRIYLLAAIVFASIYPLINLSAFVQRHEELAKPVLNWQIPAQNLIKPLNEPVYWYWIGVIFWLGAGVLATRLTVQLFSLYKLYKNSKPAIINTHAVRIMDKDAAPFSFWQSIFVNPGKHDPADLNAILLHEQVHVSQWHTADILLAELSSIFYWFNPGIWLMKKAIRENIEFITDRKILNKGIDSKSYQYSLVSVSFNNAQPGIVNHFNISTIKKRIIMMNAKRSSKIKLTRYAFLVPAVISLLLVFSISKANFAKPIRVNLVNAVKPLITIVSPDAIPSPVGNMILTKPKNATHKITKTIPGLKTDTTKKDLIIIRSNNSKDSVVYYINGVRGSLRNVEPKNIADLKVLKGDDASAYLNKNDAKDASVVLVVTKDSPEGKQFEKLNGQYKSLKQSDDVVITGYRVNPKVNLANTVSVSPGTNLNTDHSSKSSANTVTHSRLTFSLNVDTTIKNNIRANIIRVTSASNSSINGKTLSSNNISINNDKGVNISFDKNKNPLILVDGKEVPATDIKKLSPNVIETMSVINDDNATKKYGDKAKDGVILITTKK
ncbi:MAG: family peptidase [Mucilaginibacter sp.]|nr:family peptidase [Mucilaginibacter sp.]